MNEKRYDGRAESEISATQEDEFGAIIPNSQASTSSKAETFNVGEAINTIGLGRYQWALLLYAGLAWLTDAMEMMIISLLGPAVRCEWSLSAHQESNIATIVFIGSFIGANAFGALADTYGRKSGFFATAIFTFVFGIASSLAPSYGWLLLLRFFVGIGLGGAHVPVALFMEFVPTKNRGLMLVALQSFWTIGTVIEAGIGWVALQPLGWRGLLAISSAPMLLLTLLYPVIPESPFWLAAAGRTDKAEHVLRQVAKVNDRPMPHGRLEMKHRSIGQEDGGFLSDLKTLWLNILSMFTKGLGLTTVLLLIIWSANALIYFSEVLLTTVLQAQKEESVCGDNHKLHLSSAAMLDVFVTSFAEVPGLIAAALLIDPLGRKKTMFCALVLVFASTGLLVLSPSYTLAKLFISRAASMGGFTVLIVYTPEVYPTYVRSFAMGITNSTSRIGAILSPLVAVGLAQSGHLTAAEMIVTMLALLAACCVVALPFETKGHDLEEETKPIKPVSSGPDGLDFGRISSEGDIAQHHLLRSMRTSSAASL